MQEILSSVFQSPPMKAVKSSSSKTPDSSAESDHSFQTLLRQKTSQGGSQSQRSETSDKQVAYPVTSQSSTEDEPSVLSEQQLLAAALAAQAIGVFPEECAVLSNASATPVSQPSPLSAVTLGTSSINPGAQSQVTVTDNTPPSPILAQAATSTSPSAFTSQADTASKEDAIQTLRSLLASEQAPVVDVEETVPTTAASPLFSSEEGIPVKVGEPLALDTQSADMDNQLAKEIIRVAGPETTRLKVNLSPESLGTITIEVSRSQDGTLRVALSAANERAQALLDYHSASLQSLLANNTRGTVQVEVARQETSQSSQQEQAFYDQGGQGGGRQQQQHHQQQSQPQQEQDFFQRLRLGLTALDTEAS